MNATPIKLRNGTWGATVKGAVSVGDLVQIWTQTGKSWDARVTAVVWTGSGVSICATQSTTPAKSKASKYSRPGWYGPRECKTGGNCSSVGTGRTCGAPDCDGY